MSAPSASRRDLRHAFFMAMEMAWIATAVAFLDAMIGGEGRPAAAWSLWLYPAAYVFARIERRLPARAVARLALRIVLGGGAGLATLTALVWPDAADILAAGAAHGWSAALPRLAEAGAAPVLLVAVTCAFAAARGWLLGPRPVDGDGFLAGLQLGIMILLAVAFLRHLAGLPTTAAVAGTVIFLATGLYGLWLCRWLDSDFAGRAPGRLGWPLLAAAIVGGILLVGALWWSEVDHGLVDWLLTPVYWLGEAINRLLLYLSQFVPEHRPLDLPPPPAPPARQGPAVAEQINRFSDWTRLIGRILLAISVGGLAAMLILRNLSDLLRWLSRRPRPARGITHDASSFDFWDDLKDILAILRDAARQVGRWLARWCGRRPAGPPAEVRAVRRTYARLLARMANRGWPRASGQTPHEYLETLHAAIPHRRADVALITEAYVGVRYGAVIPRPELLAAVRDGWRRVRRAKIAAAKS